MKESTLIIALLTRIFVLGCVFFTGVMYADSNKGCSISMHQNGDTHTIYGVKHEMH
jgi:hypothetical protein